MTRRYYDEDEDEFIEGEWLSGEPPNVRSEDIRVKRVRGTEGFGPPRSFSKKFTIRIDPKFTFGRGGPGYRPPSPQMPSGKKGFSFSEMERKHLFFATIVIIVAFMMFFHRGISAGLNNLFTWPYFLVVLLAALVAVLTGFLTHEMAHKFTAQKMGYWAEFRYSTSGLFFALLFSLFGFIIAAPGAVYIHGRLSKKENGITSFAGPLINSIWGTIFIGGIFLLNMMNVPGTDSLKLGSEPLIFFSWDIINGMENVSLYWQILWSIISWGFILNTFFAAFNLLPIRFLGLDGYKILDWNYIVYFFFVAVVTGFLYLSLGTTYTGIFVVICFVMGIYRKMG